MGDKLRQRKMWGGMKEVKKSKVEEARNILQATVLAHVPVSFACLLLFHDILFRILPRIVLIGLLLLFDIIFYPRCYDLLLFSHKNNN